MYRLVPLHGKTEKYIPDINLMRNPEYPDAESGVIRTQNPELSGQRIRSYPDRESGVIRTEVEPHKQTNFSKQLLPKQAGVVRRSRNTSKGTG